MYKLRQAGMRRFELGTTFIEDDGPYELVNIEEISPPQSGYNTLAIYNYTLRKFTAEETTIWEIHNA
jgi:hypothetical protein